MYTKRIYDDFMCENEELENYNKKCFILGKYIIKLSINKLLFIIIGNFAETKVLIIKCIYKERYISFIY